MNKEGPIFFFLVASIAAVLLLVFTNLALAQSLTVGKDFNFGNTRYILNAAGVSIGTASFTAGRLVFGPGGGIQFPDASVQTTAAVGTVTSVGSGAGLTGGPFTGSGSLSINTIAISDCSGSANKIVWDSVNSRFGCGVDNSGSGGGGDITSVNFPTGGFGISGGAASGDVLLSLDPSASVIWSGQQTFNGGAQFPGSGIWNTSGNVGIGTAGPSEKLHVVGNTRTSGSYFKDDANGWISEVSNGGNWGIYWNTAGGTYCETGDADDNRVCFVGSGGQQRAEINLNNGGALFGIGGGNVGIGTANPGSYKLYVNGTAFFAGKLTAPTIDPLYEINSKKYATYVSSIAGGVKEEYVGRGKLVFDGKQLSQAIDFTELGEGSDLWLWYKAVDFSSDNIEALATAYDVVAPIAYSVEDKKIVFKTDCKFLDSSCRETIIEFSYRLVGKRFDWRNWPTLAKDQSETPSFKLEK